jgi:hypothetical protein
VSSLWLPMCRPVEGGRTSAEFPHKCAKCRSGNHLSYGVASGVSP